MGKFIHIIHIGFSFDKEANLYNANNLVTNRN